MSLFSSDELCAKYAGCRRISASKNSKADFETSRSEFVGWIGGMGDADIFIAMEVVRTIKPDTVIVRSIVSTTSFCSMENVGQIEEGDRNRN